MIHQTKDKLAELRLSGMLLELERQLQTPDILQLSFEDRLGMLVDQELLERDNRRLQSRLAKAHLRDNACIEDIDFKTPRGIERSFVMTLAKNEWVRQHQNIIITAPTGTGKTYLACALAQKACRDGFSAQYHRVSRLLQAAATGRGDGSYAKVLEKIAKANVLVLDDWGIQTLNDSQRRDLLEIIEDRYHTQSTIIATQLPVDKWHELIGDLTIADAIMDRLVHNAHVISMKGGSMRKKLNSVSKVSTLVQN